MFTLCADGRLSLLPVKLDFRDNQRGGYSRLFIICTCTLKYIQIFPTFMHDHVGLIIFLKIPTCMLTLQAELFGGSACFMK